MTDLESRLLVGTVWGLEIWCIWGAHPLPAFLSTLAPPTPGPDLEIVAPLQRSCQPVVRVLDQAQSVFILPAWHSECAVI